MIVFIEYYSRFLEAPSKSIFVYSQYFSSGLISLVITELNRKQ